MSSTDQTTKSFVTSVSQFGGASVGVIVDVSGSMSRDDKETIRSVLVESGQNIKGIALIDTGVRVAGDTRLILNLLELRDVVGGGTDFKTSVRDAWISLGRPAALIVITDGDVYCWPERFPVQTAICVLRDAKSASSYGSLPAKLPHCTKRTNVISVSRLKAVQAEVPSAILE